MASNRIVPEIELDQSNDGLEVNEFQGEKSRGKVSGYDS